MSNHNGHKNGVNPHDAIAARIVAGAMEASKLPPAAAKAVYRALNASGAKPPTEAEKNQMKATVTAAIAAAQAPDAPIDNPPDPIALQAIGQRVVGYTNAVTAAIVRERVAPELADELTAAALEAGAVTSEQTPDGVVRIYLHGTLVACFLPPEVAQEADGSLTVNLCFQVAP